ncbi:hypothetical protein [Streptomyces avicenniae]|uniref:SCO2583 family membrane protein n=1 Tax=Streptomyces avicenniae TaxID=500153 RepID=UPI00069B97D5|nr:hypothetical protein [Streptomyces avicenniae]
MAGRYDPPGASGSAPGAGDDEYGATVFDESFVNAARIQEYSAQERLEDHTTAVRRRPSDAAGPLIRAVPRQGIALAVIVLLAFAAAIYLGSRNPYGASGRLIPDPPSGTTVVLAPGEDVPGAADAESLFENSPASAFGIGPGGVALPDPRPTENFSREQVLTALTLAKEYLVASALTPDVYAGATAVPVRQLLGEEQQRQLDAALAGRGGRSAATDWLVRFDPEEVTPAGTQVRVDGRFTFAESDEDVLQVTGHHAVAYALQPAGEPTAPVVLFTVQREVRLLFGDDELRDRRIVLRQVDTLAGPMDCASDPADALHPLLAGQHASLPGTSGIDPYELEAEHPVLCAAYAPGGAVS